MPDTNLTNPSPESSGPCLNDLPKIDLKGLAQGDIIDLVRSSGEPAFRGRQIFSWLYRPGINSFEQMSDISLAFRARLQEIAIISQLTLQAREESSDGAVKYAFSLADGNIIESVLIPDRDRFTLCVSSQVGCAMGCRFCLTGTMGFKRNLTPAEMVNQIHFVMEDLAKQGKGRLNNLVFMGMGEPLANLENLLTTLDILLDPSGLNFSDRKVTVSTCGLIPKMAELGRRASINLAISLHASDDQTRNLLMPVNATYPLASLLEACRRYPVPKRRRIMMEYIMIKGVNDSPAAARKLVKILHGIPCKINLLPFNECDALPYRCPSRSTIEVFQDILLQADYTVMIRESRGADISAACGQLAAQVMDDSPEEENTLPSDEE
jgi:23S rRNA (adenine2503-C2)-methyltransferase